MDYRSSAACIRVYRLGTISCHYRNSLSVEIATDICTTVTILVLTIRMPIIAIVCMRIAIIIIIVFSAMVTFFIVTCTTTTMRIFVIVTPRVIIITGWVSGRITTILYHSVVVSFPRAMINRVDITVVISCGPVIRRLGFVSRIYALATLTPGAVLIVVSTTATVSDYPITKLVTL